MARPRKKIETPGESAAEENISSDVQLLNSIPANTPEQLNAATAGATVLDASPAPTDIAARNEALSGLNAEAFGIVSKFETYGFVDEHGNPLTNCLDFIELVKRATTATSTQPTITSTDGQIKRFKAPTLTDKGWHVHS
ncbi:MULTISPECIES: hypothetical protein [Brenneria]|uniref:Uncharacterized protein n=1 Tax=Brenneria nigrifluens DSM 30175 = ATCC 13028 TaxID=1121120 RepID=A0A2U1UUQ5_9GAMM|nr:MULTISPECIES: hypothetical protein [Brenneria]EHD22085.1 hypothetical protein BrE312_2708 [Brenneria sp. EniD312]PWC25414.1 hypothetical protein DDT54_05830 [Brenneria nigrifluens DSM 30175 = ATCC 13028]QCR05164.1 hypothetical protein EH206_13785 [Brenneria nigrifluens DSM 30175 = ATCC 13028]